MEDKKIDKLFEFFQSLGKAKHEPCGEHWTGKLISHKIQIEIKIIFWFHVKFDKNLSLYLFGKLDSYLWRISLEISNYGHVLVTRIGSKEIDQNGFNFSFYLFWKGIFLSLFCIMQSNLSTFYVISRNYCWFFNVVWLHEIFPGTWSRLRMGRQTARSQKSPLWIIAFK